MAEAVKVGVRVRPFNEREKNLKATLCLQMNGATTTIKNVTDLTGAEPLQFSFDQSFWSHDGFEVDETGYSRAVPGSEYADQRYVFDVFGKQVLDNAWAGFHCCLFAYGQTGSGKSYSMVGYAANKGIVPISCEEIFARIDKNNIPEKTYEVTCSMIEIYNESLQDLLVLPEDRPRKGLEIRESKLLGIYIEGVTKRPVQSYEEIRRTIDEATEHRTVGATLMNATSSRAHTVVTIQFKQVQMVSGKPSEKVSMINLVDLAGSEKAGQTGAAGDRLKEGAAINKSLSALGNVIEKLAQRSGGKRNVIIPYRDSKLTRLLQNALGGSSKTIMICALSPASSNYEETLSTLRYADRAKKIKNTAIVNENPQVKLIRELKEENAALKAMMDEMKKTGIVDVQVLNDKQAEIQRAEAELQEMSKSFSERVHEAHVVHEIQVQRRNAVPGRSISSLSQSDITDKYIANLNEDMQLTGRIKHFFPEGTTQVIGQSYLKQQDGFSAFATSRGSVSRMSVGGAIIEAQVLSGRAMAADRKYPVDPHSSSGSDAEDNEPDILLVGAGIIKRHATMKCSNGMCYLLAKGKAADATYVSGQCLADRLEEEARQEDGVLLQHGDRLVFGVSSMFVFIDPARGSLELLLLKGEVNFWTASYELEQARWRKQPTSATVVGGKPTRNSFHSDCVSDGDLGAESNTLVAELRAQLEAKDSELKALKDDVAEMRAAQAGALQAALAMRNVKDGLPPPNFSQMVPQLAKARQLAAMLKTGFEHTVRELDAAKSSVEAVSAAFKACSNENPLQELERIKRVESSRKKRILSPRGQSGLTSAAEVAATVATTLRPSVAAAPAVVESPLVIEVDKATDVSVPEPTEEAEEAEEEQGDEQQETYDF
eukprot:TRINITY_DN18073_c0_g1_i1.p1 TRINITY_DN18073_c0_g1~~TRINITY_DN18073_c0_g1_i1.p1  ORF type:complete len:884 (-),score=203.21 TRINITY_DN18073_c0_g1_i1:90-2741(-)